MLTPEAGERAADAHVTHKFAGIASYVSDMRINRHTLTASDTSGRPGVSLGRRVRKEQSASMTVRQVNLLLIRQKYLRY